MVLRRRSRARPTRPAGRATALRRYQRLESTGVWREDPDTQRRDVWVTLGEASLVISDARSNTPLAHWSLPAVERRNPGERPALLSPAPDAGELLEIEDDAMIEALETVARSLQAGGRLSRRVRHGLTAAVLLGLTLLAVVWLPNALLRHTATVVPQTKRLEIAGMMLQDLAAAGLPACADPAGLAALDRLRDRLAGPDGPARLVVLRGATAPDARVLPGRVVVLGQPMIEAHDSAHVAAGHVLTALLKADQTDPLRAVLKTAGVRASFMLLTTGDLPPAALSGEALGLVAPALPLPEVPRLVERFARHGIPTSPFAYALDRSGETTLDLIEADPFRIPEAAPLILSDGDWVSLQGICSP